MSERDIYLNENRSIFEECQDLHRRVEQLEALLREIVEAGDQTDQWNAIDRAKDALKGRAE